MVVKQDWKYVADALEGGLRNLLGQLIDGTISDLDGPIRMAAARLQLAARRRHPELVEEVQDQLAMLILEKQLRLRGNSSDMLSLGLSIGLNALVDGAIAGLGGLKAV